ncbi:MAG: prolipoprotein diacylglyceryl transferase [Candidatus Spyradocola sp.]
MVCPNPVAFTVFGHDIYWYGILISLAVVIAVAMVYTQAKKKGIDPDSMLDYALLTIPTAIVFARIYYVIFEWEQYADNPISVLYIWNGGIAIYGSIIGGVIATLIFSKWKKISFWTLADLVAPGLVLGQAIGRWGNFFNQEAYGPLVTEASRQFFPYAVYIERLGEWHMATFFYESMACLAIFIFLLIYRAKAKKAPDGNLFLWYWVLYGIERFFVEGLRQDSLWMFKGGLPIGNLIFFPNGLRVSQALSFVMVIAFGIVLLVRFVKRRKAEAAQLDPELVLMQQDGAQAADSAETAGETETAEAEAESAEEPAEETSEEPAEPESEEENKQDGEQN